MSMSRGFTPVVIVIALILSACTSAATPVPTTAPTAAPTVAPTATPTTDGTLPKPELTSVKLGSPIGQFSQFGTVLAAQLKIYEKYGVQVTVTKFNAGGDAAQAVLSGAVDVAGGAGVELSINSQVTDTPAVGLSVEKLGVFEGLFCSPSIKTAADVKGKTVGISTFGSAGHGSALLDLQALGLTANDVVLTPTGGASVRAAALKAGALACAPLDSANKAAFLALGFNLLVDLSTRPEFAWPAPGITAPASWIKKYPNTALALVAADLEATSVMVLDRATTVAQWAAFSQTSPDAAGTLYDAAIVQINRDLTWRQGAFAFAQGVLASVSPGLATIDITKAYDASFLKKLNDIGFYKKVGLTYPTAPWP